MLLGQDEGGSPLAAQAQADLGIAGKEIAEPGMIVSDLAQQAFPARQDQIAQVVFV